MVSAYANSKKLTEDFFTSAKRAEREKLLADHMDFLNRLISSKMTSAHVSKSDVPDVIPAEELPDEPDSDSSSDSESNDTPCPLTSGTPEEVAFWKSKNKAENLKLRLERVSDDCVTRKSTG